MPDEKKVREIRNDVHKGILDELQRYFKEKRIPAHLPWHLTDIALKKAGLLCKYEGCDRATRARGYCMRHYQSQCRKVVSMEQEGT